jgi:hypothetical protein
LETGCAQLETGFYFERGFNRKPVSRELETGYQSLGVASPFEVFLGSKKNILQKQHQQQ